MGSAGIGAPTDAAISRRFRPRPTPSSTSNRRTGLGRRDSMVMRALPAGQGRSVGPAASAGTRRKSLCHRSCVAAQSSQGRYSRCQTDRSNAHAVPHMHDPDPADGRTPWHRDRLLPGLPWRVAGPWRAGQDHRARRSGGAATCTCAAAAGVHAAAGDAP
ncbi:hypothetical protein G6F68_017405 [Rhizopus microsporus]|nr:hypothetical protein G6F68_017405 [Rhizopus microsporus]